MIDVLGGERWRVDEGDCLPWLAGLPDGCCDCCVTSPPYPEIDREYGRVREEHWLEFMGAVMLELRRVVSSTGSYWINIGPNSGPVSSRRTWPWRFVVQSADAGHNLLFDCYWLKRNPATTVTASQFGLPRSAVEWLLWFGDGSSWREQSDVLLDYSNSQAADILNRQRLNTEVEYSPSLMHRRRDRWARDNGGATPFNYIVAAVSQNREAEHPATFPTAIPEWCIKYTCPPDGIVLDPFTGSGTTGYVALELERRFMGCELEPAYADMARERIGWAERGLKPPKPAPPADERQQVLFAEDVPA